MANTTTTTSPEKAMDVAVRSFKGQFRGDRIAIAQKAISLFPALRSEILDEFRSIERELRVPDSFIEARVKTIR